MLDDVGQPGYLIVTFPPQAVVKQACYESSPTPPPPKEETLPFNATHPPAAEPIPPGAVADWWREPPGVPDTRRFDRSIPYDIEGLLDWGALELNVSGLADIPAEPTPEQRASAPAIAKPGPRDTAIELPYRLILSPNRAVAWRHARGLEARQGVTELWHTRLALKAPDGTVKELSRANAAPLRAIWSPDFNGTKFNATDPPLRPAGRRLERADRDDSERTRHEIVVLTSGFSGYVKDLDDFTAYEPSREGRAASCSPRWAGGSGPGANGIHRPPTGDRSSPRGRTRPLEPLRDRPGQARISRPPRGGAPLVASGPAAASVAPEERAEAGAPDPGARAGAASPISAALAGAGRFESVVWPHLLGTTGSLFNVSEWSHIATLGRDHFVRIVYEGHLFPFGHRAALVKITERKIREVPPARGGRWRTWSSACSSWSGNRCVTTAFPRSRPSWCRAAAACRSGRSA